MRREVKGMDLQKLVPAQVASVEDRVFCGGPYRQIFTQIRGRELKNVPVNFENVPVTLEEGKQDVKFHGIARAIPSAKNITSTFSSVAVEAEDRLPRHISLSEQRTRSLREGKGIWSWPQDDSFGHKSSSAHNVEDGGEIPSDTRGRRHCGTLSPPLWSDSDNDPLWPDHVEMDDGNGNVSPHAAGKGGADDNSDEVQSVRYDEQDSPGWMECAQKDAYDRVIKRRRLSNWDLHVMRTKHMSSSFKKIMSRMQVKRKQGGSFDHMDDLDDVPIDVLQKLRRKIPQEQNERRGGNLNDKRAEGDFRGGRKTRVNRAQSGTFHDEQSGESLMNKDGDQHNQSLDGKKGPRNWETHHAVAKFKANTEGMRRCPEGYKNEQGQFASFSKLGDILDERFRHSSKDAFLNCKDVPVKRVGKDKNQHCSTYGTPLATSTGHACEAHVLGQSRAISPANRTCVKQQVAVPIKKASAVSRRVKSRQRQEEEKTVRLVNHPQQVGINHFHSFLPSSESMHGKLASPRIISHQSEAYTNPFDERTPRVTPQNTTRVDMQDQRILIQSDQKMTQNAARGYADLSRQRDLNGDFMDLLRRHGLTIAPRSSDSSIQLAAHPQPVPTGSVGPTSCGCNQQKVENGFKYRSDVPQALPSVAMYHTRHPVSLRINQHGLEKKGQQLLQQQQLLFKVPRQWNPGMKIDESVMLPVVVLSKKGSVPFMDKP